MKLTMVTVFDSAAQAYASPIFVPHANMARRSLQDEVNRDAANNQVHFHPEDFTLYELGFFDDNLGAFHLHAEPIMICRAKDLVDNSKT